MTAPEPPTDRLSRLQETASLLVREVEDLSRESGTQIVSLTKRARSNRRMTWVAIVLVVLAIGLSGGLGWTVFQVRANERATAAVTHRLDVAQTTTRRNTLCPLYGLFLAAKNPKSRAAFPQGPAAYDHAFGVIQQGYAALGCAAFVTKPPKTG